MAYPHETTPQMNSPVPWIEVIWPEIAKMKGEQPISSKPNQPVAPAQKPLAQTPISESQVAGATAVHDMATPLSLISNAAMALKGDCSPEDREYYLDCILRNVLSTQMMAEDFKDSVKHNVGCLQMRREQVNLSSVANEVVSDLKKLVSSHPIRFYGDPAWVLGDRAQLKRLVFNLVSNAIKYSEAGSEVKVDVWIRSSNACLFVQDQGRGIRPAEIDRLFLPFTRLEDTSDLQQGDGLGLASVKRIADAHGALLKVQGNPGQGSIFEVCFRAIDRL